VSDPSPQRWQRAFRVHRREAEALASDLSPRAFNRSPAPGAWSVGQCLDHLCETGRPLVSRLGAALARAPRRPSRDAPLRLGWLDRLFAWTMRQSAWLKIPSPGAYRPAQGSLDPQRTVEAFQALQDDLIACAERAEERNGTAVRVASPANRFMRLTAIGWLEGTRAHQRRHLRQAWRGREGVL
jgi:hypothetical protein